MEKPHRFLIDKVTSYAEEGGAYLRRRRLRSQPFARVGTTGGAIVAHDPEGERGRALITAAEELLAVSAAAKGTPEGGTEV